MIRRLWIASAILLTGAGHASTPVEQGKYVALAGNCAACHKSTFAGGVPFDTPFGKLYSTNISPDPKTGIGGWSYEQFARAMREGVSAGGDHLYPVFPYTSFTKISESDLASLYTYLQSVPPVSSQPPANDMSFPYSMRSLMSIWKAMYFEPGAYEPDASKSKEWNRGAYLVESLGHCSACHSPRNFLGAESTDLALTGGVYTDRVPGDAQRSWSAPNLTGLSDWTVEELTSYLKTGKSTYAVSFGPMNDVIGNSTQHLSDADVRAMAVYLKSLPAKSGESGALAGEDVKAAGSALYDVHCGTCHQPNGLGADDAGPRLAGSLVVQANDPASLINIILYGPELPNPAPPTGKWQHMEAYADKLTDDEVAQLASFVRTSWTNKASAVTAAQVAKQR